MRWPATGRVLEAGATAGLVGVGVAEVLTGQPVGPVPVHAAAVVALGLTLLVRRTRPLTAALAGSATVTAQCLAGWVGSAAEMVLYLVLVGTTAALQDDRARRIGLGALAGGFLVVLLRDPGIETLAAAAPSLVLFGAAAGAGIALGTRSAAAAAEVEAARRAREEQEAEATRQLAAERTRLARELHDVVTHSLCVVVVQAGAMRLDASPEQADRLAALESTARSALVEMRRMLGLLRGEPGSTLSPQPDIGQIPELLDRLRTAGLEARLEVTGRPQELAPGLALTVYRIVQEATTNVLTHARARRVVVALDWTAEHLRIRIADDGNHSTEPREGGGRGLLGLGERVALHGGRLQHGSVQGGGYELRAELPLTELFEPTSP